MRDALSSDAVRAMRTTLDLDEDVLLAAKELARDRKTTAGKVVSELVRKALTERTDVTYSEAGWPLFPLRPDSKPVTLELVNRLRDEYP
jgi:hypothetical protein